jgi:hypothetical protein
LPPIAAPVRLERIAVSRRSRYGGSLLFERRHFQKSTVF